MKLTYDEKNSPAWKKVKEYVEVELKALRSQLERDNDMEKTSKLRGRIRSLVLLLSLETDPATVVEEDVEE